MKKLFLTLGMGLLIINTSCENKSDAVVVDTTNDSIVDDTMDNDVMPDTNKTMNLNFSGASDSNLEGTAQLTQNGNEVTMKVDIAGVTPGEHAIHIHEKGDCSAPDASSAGGHWNPGGTEHGKFDMEPFHMGDIGNLTVEADGTASLTFSTDKWCIGCDDDMKNIVGRSIIIHEGVDDFKSQPTGDAGGRIGCVVIE